MHKIALAILWIAIAGAMLPQVADAFPMTGDTATVTATPGFAGVGVVFPQFISPLIVGPGVTDSADFIDLGGQSWEIKLVFSDFGLFVDFSSLSSNGNAVIASSPAVLSITLEDLTRPVGPVVRDGYFCTGPACLELNGLTGEPYGRPSDTVTVADRTVTFTFASLVNHATYAYRGEAADVPEPASLIVVSIGMGALGLLRRRG